MEPERRDRVVALLATQSDNPLAGPLRELLDEQPVDVIKLQQERDHLRQGLLDTHVKLEAVTKDRDFYADMNINAVPALANAQHEAMAANAELEHTKVENDSLRVLLSGIPGVIDGLHANLDSAHGINKDLSGQNEALVARIHELSETNSELVKAMKHAE